MLEWARKPVRQPHSPEATSMSMISNHLREGMGEKALLVAAGVLGGQILSILASKAGRKPSRRTSSSGGGDGGGPEQGSTQQPAAAVDIAVDATAAPAPLPESPGKRRKQVTFFLDQKDSAEDLGIKAEREAPGLGLAQGVAPAAAAAAQCSPQLQGVQQPTAAATDAADTVAAEQHKQLQQQLAVAQQQLEAAQQHIGHLAAQLSAARHERKKVNAEVIKAREAIAESEQRMTMALEQIVGLQARTATLMGEKRTMERSCRELSDRLGSAQAAADKAQALHRRVEQLVKELKEAVSAREGAESLMRKLIAAQNHRQQQANATVQRAQAEAEAAKKELAELRQANQLLQKELERQRGAATKSVGQLSVAQHQTRRLETDTRKFRESYAGLEAKLASIVTKSRSNRAVQQ